MVSLSDGPLPMMMSGDEGSSARGREGRRDCRMIFTMLLIDAPRRVKNDAMRSEVVFVILMGEKEVYNVAWLPINDFGDGRGVDCESGCEPLEMLGGEWNEVYFVADACGEVE